MTLFFTTHSIAIYRQRRQGSTNRHTMSATGTIEPADITPASLERVQFVGGQIGKAYIGYAEVGADIKENDRIKVTSGEYVGRTFEVKSVSLWQGFGNVDCKELDLISKD